MSKLTYKNGKKEVSLEGSDATVQAGMNMVQKIDKHPPDFSGKNFIRNGLSSLSSFLVNLLFFWK